MMSKKNKNKRHEEPAEPADTTAGDQADLASAEELRDMLAEVESERDDLRDNNERLLRGAAQLQNELRQQREMSKKDADESRRQGMAAVVRSVVLSLDHFDLALGQDPEKVSSAQLIDGVRVIREELLRALAQHGVVPIQPEPGEAFDPMRHEAVYQQPSETVEPGCVIEMMQGGYALGDRTLRPAMVSVAAARDESASEEG